MIKIKNNLQNYLKFLPAIAISILLFFYLTGGTILNPNYYQWLGGADTSQHYLGWLFFKDGDVFQKIAGENPNYGYEISGSIVYTDSIPLLAIFFKTFFKNFLSTNFQYFGIWILFCFIMQAICSMVLLKKFTDNFSWQFLGSIFFIFSTPLIFRIFNCEHYALAAHFLILISLIFYFSKDFSLWRWTLLFIVTLGIHFYIFVMIFLIFLADLLQKSLIEKTTVIQKINFTLSKIIISAPFIIFAMLQYGYFTIGAQNSSADLYGYINLNLLSLFDSNGWSKIFPDFKDIEYGYEGFCYLGYSIILMLFIILTERIFGKKQTHQTKKNKLKYKNILPLAGAMIFLTLIALSNHIFLGDRELFVIPISRTLEVFLGIIRASGRMFWPCYYVILLFTIISLIRIGEKYNFSKNKITIFLAFLVFLQILDLRLGLVSSRQKLLSHYSNTSLDENLKDDFWQNAKIKYKKIIFVPVKNSPPNYAAIAYFAAINHMKTNSGYFARTDNSKADFATIEHKNNIEIGNFEGDAFYIFNDDNIYETAIDKAREKDLVAEIDGYKIIAPNFKAE